MCDDKIMNMENKPTGLEELFFKLKDYGETTLDLYKLKAINKISGFSSTLIVSVFLIVLLFLILICITIGFGLLIGMWLGNTFWGFFYNGRNLSYHRTCPLFQQEQTPKTANKR